MRLIRVILAALCALLAGALVGRADLVAEGVASGLSVCLDVLLPSLFPFMSLAGFVALSGLGGLVALPFRPVTRRLLRLPDELGAVWLAGMAGGYPTGAGTLATLVQGGRLSSGDAARMLSFCINPGPAFVVVAVGRMMFGSTRAGWLLLLSQCFSSLLIGWLAMRGGKPISASSAPPLGLADALVTAVKNASFGMLSVCSYVLLFSALSSLIAPLAGGGRLSALIIGLLEVTSGCAAAAGLGGRTGILLAAFLISFSGLSVLCQASALALGAGIRPRRVLTIRLAGGLLSGLFTALLLRVFGAALPALSSNVAPLAVVAPRRMLGAVCLACMLLTVLGDPAREKL